MRDQFTFSRTFWEAISPLPKTVQVEAIMALCAYALDGVEPDGLSPMAAALFMLVRPSLDASAKMSAGGKFQSTRPLRGGTAILHKKTVQNIAYCTKSAFTLAVLSGFLALMRSFFLPNVHKFRCEPSEESLLTPRSHAYTIRTPSG